MNNAVLWDVTLCCSVRRLLVTANVSSSQIQVTLTMEALRSSEPSVPTRVTRRNIPEELTFLEQCVEENIWTKEV
jgi:hypothetical protein